MYLFVVALALAYDFWRAVAWGAPVVAQPVRGRYAREPVVRDLGVLLPMKTSGVYMYRRVIQGSTLGTVRLPGTIKSGCRASRFPCKLARQTTRYFWGLDK
jgi:hypothetical protein